jgi:hypothetical protein
MEKKLRQLQSSIPEEPLVELDADLKTLSLTARQFLSSQGIATAEAFLSTKSATVADALMDWRKRWDSNACSIASARVCIYEWKKRLRERQSSMSGEPLAELDADLKTLRPMARRFLSSQGIATAEIFLSTNSPTMVNALMDWRKRWDSREYSMASAQACIYQWKHILRQLKPSMPKEPLIEQDAELQNLSPMAS